MTITITIDTDNAAFHDEDGDQDAITNDQEITRILQAIRWPELLWDGGSASLRDVNGNTVGKVEVTL